MEIHTLNARSSMLLSIVHGLVDHDATKVNRVITCAAQRLAAELGEHEVSYADLGPALTPRPNRREVGLFFEIAAIGSSSYGHEIHNAVLPMLGRKESHSVLAGDLIGDQEQLGFWLRLHMTVARPYSMASIGTQVFCVYITNCSDSALGEYTRKLRSFPSFLGGCDFTYSSAFRSYVADRLTPRYVQIRSQVLHAGGDEGPLVKPANELGYEFARAGLAAICVQSTFFDLLLAFKVERPPMAWDEPDQHFAMNAVSVSPLSLVNCSLEIDKKKLQYLLEQKPGIASQLGLTADDTEMLTRAIWKKLLATYFYRLRYSAEHQFSGFTAMLELDAKDTDQPLRVAVGLGIEERRQAVRLVTLF